jgi:hypothetical protein
LGALFALALLILGIYLLQPPSNSKDPNKQEERGTKSADTIANNSKTPQ